MSAGVLSEEVVMAARKGGGESSCGLLSCFINLIFNLS